jgi:hypothetical protein
MEHRLRAPNETSPSGLSVRVFSVFCGSIFDASRGGSADAKMGTGSRFSEAHNIAAIDE